MVTIQAQFSPQPVKFLKFSHAVRLLYNTIYPLCIHTASLTTILFSSWNTIISFAFVYVLYSHLSYSLLHTVVLYISFTLAHLPFTYTFMSFFCYYSQFYPMYLGFPSIYIYIFAHCMLFFTICLYHVFYFLFWPFVFFLCIYIFPLSSSGFFIRYLIMIKTVSINLPTC